MKKFLMLSCAFLFSTVIFAQSNKEDIDILQSVLGKQKKEIVSGFVQLNAGAQADAFWKNYDAYENERKSLGRKRIELLEKYASNYGTMDDAQMDQLVKEIQNLQVSTDKLIVKYYGIIKKSSGVKPAAQFYQLEGYLLSIVRCSILENIPFIGELDDK